MGAEEHKQWCDYRRIFLASRFACALVYRAGPANPPVLQAKHFESVKSLSLSFNIHVLTALMQRSINVLASVSLNPLSG